MRTMSELGRLQRAMLEAAAKEGLAKGVWLFKAWIVRRVAFLQSRLGLRTILWLSFASARIFEVVTPEIDAVGRTIAQNDRQLRLVSVEEWSDGYIERLRG